MTVADYSRVPEIAAQPYNSPLARRLQALWETKPGLIGWLSTVDHKEIGVRYLVTAFAFLILGGIEALIVRLQLAQPNSSVVTPGQYNQLFSMHGVTMIFLYALPVLSGFSNYLWPLILGSRDMALPRLNAFSYWTYLFSGLFLYAGFAIGAGPNDGWFNYVPYATKPYNPGPSQDFYALGFIFFGLSVTVGGINFLVTALRTRAPGMSINRFPMMIWGTLTASAGNLLAIPSVSIAFFMLWTDRQFGTHFFSVEAGGQPLLWQHLFWMFGHPWVYAIVLPAMSMVSDGLPVFCRRPLVGHTAVALATVVTMIIGFGVWVHHMFATGLPNLAMSFFNAASFIIVIPSAVSVFAWVATIWTGRFIYATASLFFVSFIFLFVVGGVSGFLTGSVPVDWQLTDTYFVVGHIHYVLIGINVFPVVGALYFWFPKMTGRLLNETSRTLELLDHVRGLQSRILSHAHRRPDGHAPARLHLPGRHRLEHGQSRDHDRRLPFRRRRPAAADQRRDQPQAWPDRRAQSVGRGQPRMVDAFASAALQLRRAADGRQPPPALGGQAGRNRRPLLGRRGRRARRRQGDAGRERARCHTRRHPQDAARFGHAVLPRALPGGILYRPPDPVMVAPGREPRSRTGGQPVLAVAACQPRPDDAARGMTDLSLEQRLLPVGSAGKRSTGWWAMLCIIATEGSIFAFLQFSYYYIAVQQPPGTWPPGGRPEIGLSAANTLVLLSSSVAVWWGERAIGRGNRLMLSVGLAVGLVLGGAFVGIQVIEWSHKSFTFASHTYGSLYFTITALHIAHVVVGLIVLAALLAWSLLGYFNGPRHAAISTGAIYWHFVDAVWITIFFTFYVLPYLQ